MKISMIEFMDIKPFKFQIKYNEIYSTSPSNVFYQHTHNECEIYINLTGDISFMVEDNIYPISAGNIIISRPHESHHCIYNSNSIHKYFWILFSCKGNERLLDLFFKRRSGENNLIILQQDNVFKLNDICRKMLNKDINSVEQYACFFELLKILNDGNVKTHTNSKLSHEIISSIDIINENLSSTISIKELAKKNHISISTFERKFKSQTGLTPQEYICKKRLSLAALMLSKGSSVQDACDKCGFSDCSHFIIKFKKVYGMTPLQYKKQYSI